MRALGRPAGTGLLALALGILLGAAPSRAEAARRLGATRGPLAALSPAQLTALLAQTSRLPFHERVLALSRLFLGTPYVLDPLGEGPQGGVDRDPLFDLGHVDCQTFVEQVMAMAGARSAAEFVRRLQRVRYRGAKIGYRERHHLMALGWIPGNVRAGFIRDLTREVAGDRALVVSKLVDRRQWRGRFARMLQRLGDRAPSGEARLDYVPLSELLRVAPRLPRVSVAYVVAQPREGVPYVVTHMGFVLREASGRLVFRHASAHPRNRRVVDVPLFDYLVQLRRGRREEGRRRKILGLAFSALVPGPPR